MIQSDIKVQKLIFPAMLSNLYKNDVLRASSVIPWIGLARLKLILCTVQVYVGRYFKKLIIKTFQRWFGWQAVFCYETVCQACQHNDICRVWKQSK